MHYLSVAGLQLVEPPAEHHILNLTVVTDGSSEKVAGLEYDGT
jgi:hypothetical protein